MRILLILLAVSVGLNAGMLYVNLAGGDGGAEPRHPRRGAGPPAGDIGEAADTHLALMTRHLDLDAAQQQEIGDLLRAHLPGIMAARRAAGDANRRLGDLFAAPELDVAAFAAAVDAAGRARGRADSLAATLLVAEAGILTLEQRTTFAAVAARVYAEPGGPAPREPGGPPPGRPHPGPPPPGR